MKISELKTTTDVLNYASELVQRVENCNRFEVYKKSVLEGKRVEAFINDHLESGCHVGQARHELLGAKYLATSGIYQARRNNFERKGWRL